MSDKEEPFGPVGSWGWLRWHAPQAFNVCATALDLLAALDTQPEPFIVPRATAVALRHLRQSLENLTAGRDLPRDENGRALSMAEVQLLSAIHLRPPVSEEST